MTQLNFVRGLTADDHFDINNPHVTDANGVQIYLATQLQASFPAHAIGVVLDGTAAVVTMTPDLSPAEITTVQGIVAAHQADAAAMPFPNGVPERVPVYPLATLPPPPLEGSAIIVVSGTVAGHELAFWNPVATAWEAADGSTLA